MLFRSEQAVERRLVLRLGTRHQHVLGVGRAEQPPAVGRGDPRAIGAVDVGAFGLDNCLWGSDWPFVAVAERPDYGDVLAPLLRWFPDAGDRARVLAHDGMSVIALRLFELLPRHPIVTVASVMKLVDTTKPTAGRAIELLVAANVLVETTGRKRDRCFMYRSYLDRLRVGTELGGAWGPGRSHTARQPPSDSRRRCRPSPMLAAA